jgi:fatty acid desaturase
VHAETGPDPQDPAGPAPSSVPDPRLRTVALVRWGILLWVVALLVLLAVPPLRSGGREWWVWVPVAGALLGLVGHVYLARGRGNARLA